jgi:hypothetical protein
MPLAYRRDAIKAMAEPSAPGDEEAYRGAFRQDFATVRVLQIERLMRMR